MSTKSSIGSKTKKSTPKLKKLTPRFGVFFQTSGGGLEEEAEETLLNVLEERKARASMVENKDWVPSVQGEQPPLSRVSFHQGVSVFDASEHVKEDEEEHRKKFQMLAHKVLASKGTRKLGVTSLEARRDSNQRGEETEDVFDGVAGSTNKKVATDKLVSAALAVQENYEKDDDETASMVSDSVYSDITEDVGTEQERLPLTGSNMAATQTRQSGWFHQSARRWRKCKKKCFKFLHKTCRCNHYWFGEVLHPVSLLKASCRFITNSFFTRLGLPCLIAAFILFYHLYNPSIDFMEGTAISWWLVFVARQTLTLQLAILTESILIDAFALKSRFAIKIFSPLLTLCVISSKGWPFLCTSWALWDLILLHGDGQFQQNWLYWTHITLFSPANPGGSVLDSDTYLRILLAAIMTGVATAIKRTSLALYFGKKSVVHYKPRMDKILADMAIESEVGELAGAADDLAASASGDKELLNAAVKKKAGKEMLTAAQWSDIEIIEASGEDELKSDQEAPSDLDELEQDPNLDEEQDPNLKDAKMKLEETSSDDSDSKDDLVDDDSSDNVSNASKESPFSVSRISLTSSERHFKDLLDRWKEPEQVSKNADASISDILDFRKQLTVMDTPYPFSKSFGKASTRDECILSAKKTYRRLLKLDPGAKVLSFEVIALLSVDSHGAVDTNRRRMLRRLFRPDRFDELSLLAFVQAYDSVYRRLRYFRASVGNDSVIDQVLEQVVNGIFFFVLLLLVLSVLNLNPWTLLVSISTLLFSTAFAIGPSLSRIVEGVLMIVARRPYDLGDRILICSPQTAANVPPQQSWFVEDLNLITTTLRFAQTNEVATVNNGCLTLTRIVNLNRSPNATITLTLYFMDTATEEQLSVFHDTIESFILKRPNIWESMLFFLCESINHDLELMEYSLCARHTKSWQDAPSVLMDKSELLKLSFETAKKLGISYDSPPRATYTVNTFAASDDSTPDMDTALKALSNQGLQGEDLNAATALLQGKAKGMRSLESVIKSEGGQFASSR